MLSSFTKPIFNLPYSRILYFPCSRLSNMSFSSLTSSRKEIIYYDLETTGINAYNKHKGVEILEIGAISNSHGEIFQQYILPTKPISPEATTVHGIFMKEKDDSSELDWNSLYINEDGEARKVDAVDKVTGFTRFITWMETFESKLTLAGYNSHSYDDWVLCHEMQGVVEKEQVGIHTFADVSKIVRPILEEKRMRKWNLGLAVAHFLKREQDRAHGALSDARDCRDLLVNIGEMQNKTAQELLVGNRYARKEFDDVWTVCFNMANPNRAEVGRTEGPEHNVPLPSSAGRPLIREIPELAFFPGYGSDLKETATKDQNRAEEQEAMIDDNYYDQFSPGSEFENLAVTDCNEFGLNEDAKEPPIDSHIEDEEGKEMDFTEDARRLLNAIKIVGPKAGIGMSCLLLTGADDKRLWPAMRRTRWYGSGKDKSKDYWMVLTGALLMNKYLDEICHEGVYARAYNGYKVNSLGLKVLRDEDFVVKMKQTKELKQAAEAKLEVRNGRVVEMPYSIQKTFTMFEECKDVEEVAKMRGLKKSTVMGYLATALELGAQVDIRDLNVSESMLEDVSKIIRKKPIDGDVSKLKPIKTELELVGSDVGYDQIKLVIAKLKVDHGVNQLGILQWTDSEAGQNLTKEGNRLESQKCV